MVLALHEAKPRKFIEHRDHIRRIAWTDGYAADAVGPPRLLHHRSERTCNPRAHKRDELAPPHRLCDISEYGLPAQRECNSGNGGFAFGAAGRKRGIRKIKKGNNLRFRAFLPALPFVPGAGPRKCQTTTMNSPKPT